METHILPSTPRAALNQLVAVRRDIAAKQEQLVKLVAEERDLLRALAIVIPPGSCQMVRLGYYDDHAYEISNRTDVGGGFKVERRKIETLDSLAWPSETDPSPHQGADAAEFGPKQTDPVAIATCPECGSGSTRVMSGVFAGSYRCCKCPSVFRVGQREDCGGDLRAIYEPVEGQAVGL